MEKRKKIKYLDNNLCIKINTQLLEDFKNLCERQGIPTSEVTRDLIKEYIKKHKGE